MGCVLSCRFLGLATSAVHDHHGEARSCNFHPALHSHQTDLRLLLLLRASDWTGVIRVKLFLCAQGALVASCFAVTLVCCASFPLQLAPCEQQVVFGLTCWGQKAGIA